MVGGVEENLQLENPDLRRTSICAAETCLIMAFATNVTRLYIRESSFCSLLHYQTVVRKTLLDQAYVFYIRHCSNSNFTTQTSLDKMGSE